MTYQSAQDYYGERPEVGSPSATEIRDGQVLRLETNGDGRVVERVVGTAKPTSFGLPRGQAGRMRERLRKMGAEKENAGLDGSEVQREILRALSEDGPMTKDELASRLRVWTHQVNCSLSHLRASGQATCYADPSAGGRKFLWRLPSV